MNIAVARTFTTTETPKSHDLPIRRFIEHYSDALRHAGRLLGGHEMANVVDEIADALDRENVLSRRTMSLLQDLEELLFLENVSDPHRAEAGYFAAIDPFDPVVEEICLLADGLRAALDIRFEMFSQNDDVTGPDRTWHSSPPNLHSPNVLAVCATSTEDVQ